VVNPDGSYTYTPDADYFGGDSFTFVANDGVVDSPAATVSITVDPVNDAPVAQDDSFAVDEDGTLEGLVLGNDSDVDTAALGAVLVSTTANGTLTLNADGSFTYAPNADYYGADSFTYRASDGELDSADAAMVTIDVRPTPDAPVLAAVPDQAVSEGAILSFAVAVTDVDLPEDTLGFSLIEGPANASIDAATGLFSWAPSEEQGPGTHAFTVRVVDGFGLEDTTSFSVTVDEDSSIDAGLQADDGMPDAFRLFLDGETVKVELNGVVVFMRALADIEDMTVTGSGDDDTLIIDFSGGDPLPAGGLAYDGGGPGDDDALSLTGGTAGSVVYTAADAHSGTVSVDGATITYTGLEPIFDDLAAVSREFVFGDGADDIQLAVGLSRSLLTSPSSESIDFANPSGGVVIRSAGGDDTVTVSGEHAYDVLVDAGGGSNTIAAGFPVGLLVTGTQGADVIEIGQTGDVVIVHLNGETSTATGAARVVVDAMGGDDVVDAAGAFLSVTLKGGEGDDWLVGGAGNDFLYGGPGDDTLAGNDGVDLLDGGAGHDTARLAGVAPIAYWNLNETSGSVVADAAGTPQDGVLYGKRRDLDDPGPPPSQAPFGAGTSVDLHDSKNEYIAVPHDAAFEVAQGTIQLWFKTRDANERQTLFSKDRDGRDDGLRIGLDDRDLRVEFEDGKRLHVIDTRGTAFNNLVKSNTWYQLTFTFGAGGMKLYVDGTLVGSNGYAGGLAGNREAIVIGGSTQDDRGKPGSLGKLKVTDSFDGHIDEVAFYGVALTAEQIAQTRQRGALGVIAPSDQADSLVDIEHVAVGQAADTVTVGPDGGDVEIGDSTRGHGDWLSGLLADLRHFGLRELIGELKEHGAKLFGHTSGRMALFSVEGVQFGEERDVRDGARRGSDPECELPGWTRQDNGHGTDVQAAHEKLAQPSAEAKKNAEKTIQWGDSFRGLGAGLVASQVSGKRSAPQGNLAEFAQQPKAKHKPGR
ncbi:MAG: Ig-like domain-containing protein, partial [Burkholderiales bacterium]